MLMRSHWVMLKRKTSQDPLCLVHLSTHRLMPNTSRSPPTLATSCLGSCLPHPPPIPLRTRRPPPQTPRPPRRWSPISTPTPRAPPQSPPSPSPSWAPRWHLLPQDSPPPTARSPQDSPSHPHPAHRPIQHLQWPPEPPWLQFTCKYNPLCKRQPSQYFQKCSFKS